MWYKYVDQYNNCFIHVKPIKYCYIVLETVINLVDWKWSRASELRISKPYVFGFFKFLLGFIFNQPYVTIYVEMLMLLSDFAPPPTTHKE